MSKPIRFKFLLLLFSFLFVKEMDAQTGRETGRSLAETPRPTGPIPTCGYVSQKFTAIFGQDTMMSLVGIALQDRNDCNLFKLGFYLKSKRKVTSQMILELKLTLNGYYPDPTHTQLGDIYDVFTEAVAGEQFTFMTKFTNVRPFLSNDSLLVVLKISNEFWKEYGASFPSLSNPVLCSIIKEKKEVPSGKPKEVKSSYAEKDSVLGKETLTTAVISKPEPKQTDKPTESKNENHKPINSNDDPFKKDSLINTNSPGTQIELNLPSNSGRMKGDCGYSWDDFSLAYPGSFWIKGGLKQSKEDCNKFQFIFSLASTKPLTEDLIKTLSLNFRNETSLESFKKISLKDISVSYSKSTEEMHYFLTTQYLDLSKDIDFEKYNLIIDITESPELRTWVNSDNLKHEVRLKPLRVKREAVAEKAEPKPTANTSLNENVIAKSNAIDSNKNEQQFQIQFRGGYEQINGDGGRNIDSIFSTSMTLIQNIRDNDSFKLKVIYAKYNFRDRTKVKNYLNDFYIRMTSIGTEKTIFYKRIPSNHENAFTDIFASVFETEYFNVREYCLKSECIFELITDRPSMISIPLRLINKNTPPEQAADKGSATNNPLIDSNKTSPLFPHEFKGGYKMAYSPPFLHKDTFRMITGYAEQNPDNPSEFRFVFNMTNNIQIKKEEVFEYCLAGPFSSGGAKYLKLGDIMEAYQEELPDKKITLITKYIDITNYLINDSARLNLSIPSGGNNRVVPGVRYLDGMLIEKAHEIPVHKVESDPQQPSIEKGQNVSSNVLLHIDTTKSAFVEKAKEIATAINTVLGKKAVVEVNEIEMSDKQFKSLRKPLPQISQQKIKKSQRQLKQLQASIKKTFAQKYDLLKEAPGIISNLSKVNDIAKDYSFSYCKNQLELDYINDLFGALNKRLKTKLNEPGHLPMLQGHLQSIIDFDQQFNTRAANGNNAHSLLLALINPIITESNTGVPEKYVVVVNSIAKNDSIKNGYRVKYCHPTLRDMPDYIYQFSYYTSPSFQNVPGYLYTLWLVDRKGVVSSGVDSIDAQENTENFSSKEEAELVISKGTLFKFKEEVKKYVFKTSIPFDVDRDVVYANLRKLAEDYDGFLCKPHDIRLK